MTRPDDGHAICCHEGSTAHNARKLRVRFSTHNMVDIGRHHQRAFRAPRQFQHAVGSLGQIDLVKSQRPNDEASFVG
jgi:hypothetical protein